MARNLIFSLSPWKRLSIKFRDPRPSCLTYVGGGFGKGSSDQHKVKEGEEVDSGRMCVGHKA